MAKTATRREVSSEPKGVKVIVVGGGAAGLFAAYKLKAKGIDDFLILEAKSVVGGRVGELTNFTDLPLDLGAEWIHYRPGRILQELLIYPDDKQAVVNDTIDKTFRYTPQSYMFYQGGKLRPVPKMLRRLVKDDDWKFLNTTWSAYLHKYVCQYVEDKVILNTAVRTIDCRCVDKVAVKATTTTSNDVSHRVFLADKVIVATPITILQDTKMMEFVPPLPQPYRRAIDRIHMPAGLKVWIEFNECFYSDSLIIGRILPYCFRSIEGLWFNKTSEKLYLDAMYGKPSDRNVLLLFQIGDSKELVRRVAMNEKELVDDVLKELDQVYGDRKASRHYVQHYVQNWWADPYIRGCYSCSPVRTRILQEPIHQKRIYLAGEYLGWEEQATVYGAARSGIRAAVLASTDI